MKKSSIAKKRSHADTSSTAPARERSEERLPSVVIPRAPRLPKMDVPPREASSSGPDSLVADLQALTSTMPPPMVLGPRKVDAALFNLTNGFGNELLTRPATGRWNRAASMVVAIAASLSLGYFAGAASPDRAVHAAETAIARTALASGALGRIGTTLEHEASAPESAPSAPAAPNAAEETKPAAGPAEAAPIAPREANLDSARSAPMRAASPVEASEETSDAAAEASPGSAEIQPPETLEETLVAPPFAQDIAAASLAIAAGNAAQCGASEGAVGAAQVRVVFSTTGRVTSATLVGGQLRGTPAGSCVAVAMRKASVPAFAGEPVAVTRTVYLR